MRRAARWWTTTTRWYTAIAILITNTLALIVCAEIVATGALKVRPALTFVGHEPPDQRERSPYYASQTWAPQYWKEFALTRRQQYHAFTVWRRAPFRGETINIDDRGVRLTPRSECGSGAFKVFTFGSSHMWGTGAPDWGTIAAYLDADLEKQRGRPICVTNFGESGYVSTQSVIELMLQLQAGNIPDVAIFSDGVADVYAAYQSGRAAGVHENFDSIAARVEQTRRSESSPALQLLESSSLFKLVDAQVAKLSAANPPNMTVLSYETMHVDRDALTEAIVRSYVGNYQIVSALARQYGFDYYFFWPPYISSGNKTLTSEERRLKHAVDPALQRLHDSVDRVMETRIIPRYTHLYSMSGIFDGCTPLLWLDDAHTTPDGNQIIAGRMAQVIGHERRTDSGVR